MTRSRLRSARRLGFLGDRDEEHAVRGKNHQHQIGLRCGRSLALSPRSTDPCVLRDRRFCGKRVCVCGGCWAAVGAVVMQGWGRGGHAACVERHRARGSLFRSSSLRSRGRVARVHEVGFVHDVGRGRSVLQGSSLAANARHARGPRMEHAEQAACSKQATGRESSMGSGKGCSAAVDGSVERRRRERRQDPVEDAVSRAVCATRLAH